MGNIKFPVKVSKIEYGEPSKTYYEKVGMWVSIRPRDKACEGKTFLGIYLGDLILQSLVAYHPDSKVLKVMPHQNPAIYVPDLKRVVWGCESWWRKIKSPEQLREITDTDIKNVWYVRALKELKEQKGA